MKEVTAKIPEIYKLLPETFRLGSLHNDQALSNPKMQQLLKDPSTKFDIVIIQPHFTSEVGYYLAYRFKAPFAIFDTIGSKIPYYCNALGQPFNPSYTRMPVITVEGDMNIFHRALNTFVTFAFEHLFRNIYVLNLADGVLDKHFPSEARPSLLEIERNVSVVFDFGNPFILSGWTPMAPNYVQLGLLNCRPGKDFAENEQIGNFLKNSKKGVVFISFGSVLKDSMLGHKNKF